MSEIPSLPKRKEKEPALKNVEDVMFNKDGLYQGAGKTVRKKDSEGFSEINDPFPFVLDDIQKRVGEDFEYVVVYEKDQAGIYSDRYNAIVAQWNAISGTAYENFQENHPDEIRASKEESAFWRDTLWRPKYIEVLETPVLCDFFPLKNDAFFVPSIFDGTHTTIETTLWNQLPYWICSTLEKSGMLSEKTFLDASLCCPVQEEFVSKNALYQIRSILDDGSYDIISVYAKYNDRGEKTLGILRSHMKRYFPNIADETDQQAYQRNVVNKKSPEYIYGTECCSEEIPCPEIAEISGKEIRKKKKEIMSVMGMSENDVYGYVQTYNEYTSTMKQDGYMVFCVHAKIGYVSEEKEKNVYGRMYFTMNNEGHVVESDIKWYRNILPVDGYMMENRMALSQKEILDIENGQAIDELSHEVRDSLAGVWGDITDDDIDELLDSDDEDEFYENQGPISVEVLKLIDGLDDGNNDD